MFACSGNVQIDIIEMCGGGLDQNGYLKVQEWMFKESFKVAYRQRVMIEEEIRKDSTESE